MDFEESAALEAIIYSCMFTPCSYNIHATVDIRPHMCDRMATESIQAALGMKTTQLNLHPP
jgi:hypothetical protein